MGISRVIQNTLSLVPLYSVFFLLGQVLWGYPAQAATEVLRVGVVRQAGDTTAEICQGAFLQTLGASASVSQDALFTYTDADSARVATSKLLARNDLDLVLAGGVLACADLASHPSASDFSVVALSPECTPALLQEREFLGTVLFFSSSFYEQRLELLHRAMAFTSLGVIGPADNTLVAEKYRIQLLAAAAKQLGTRENIPVFTFEGMPIASPENCREALDSLFFDEVRVLLLDNECFEPSRDDFQELLALAQQRGMLPISISDAGLAEQGALVAPLQADAQKTGQELAAAFLQLRAGKAAAPYVPKFQASFAVNISTALTMAYDPPIGLFFITHKIITQD